MNLQEAGALALQVPCPVCKLPADSACRNPDSLAALNGPHAARFERAVIVTDAIAHNQREEARMARTWLDDVIVAYGEPRVRVDEPVRMRDDEGDYEKCCWVWFPSDANHHISIKKYRRWASFEDRTTYSYWIVDLGSHLPEMPSVTWRTRTEPSDELMDWLLAATGFLNTPVTVAAT